MKTNLPLLTTMFILGFLNIVYANSHERERISEQDEYCRGDVALVKTGEIVFKQCRSCHQFGPAAKHGVGPVLNDVLNSAAGSKIEYKYSDAFKKVSARGLRWDILNINEFLIHPGKFIPGTAMKFRGLSYEGDRQAVIAFLACSK
ncbi:cytochrome c family protein [Pararhizobium sp. IMCC21322]|uniref:c-type cytochrome n=1 Tax=Pararhizobium sp. IMCC21322 TaxID=3067903 RepID=UPI002740D257|nr:hypothetical protein [Pararhizobium sp. IMCC21322]